MLTRLESHFGYAHDYHIQWTQLGGKVKGPTGRMCQAFIDKGEIYIQTASFVEAQKLLIHEFIEGILLVEFTEPYNRLIMRFIGHFQDECYERRERLVDRLTRFIVKEMIDNGW